MSLNNRSFDEVLHPTCQTVATIDVQSSKNSTSLNAIFLSKANTASIEASQESETPPHKIPIIANSTPILKKKKKVRIIAEDKKREGKVKERGPYKKVVLSRCSKSTSRWVNPSLQRLIQRNLPFLKKRFVVGRSQATRIRNRTIYYFPIPRVFPFYCGICQRSTRHLDVIKDHQCMKKRAQDYDLTNEQRIASMGFRSRAKDAMAVMERVPNPQHFDICMVIYHDADDIVPPLPVKSLRQLCATIIQPLLPPNYHGAVELKKRKNGLEPHNGVMCTVCGVTFLMNGSYEDHLKEEINCQQGTAEPVYIAVKRSCAIASKEKPQSNRRSIRCENSGTAVAK